MAARAVIRVLYNKENMKPESVASSLEKGVTPAVDGVAGQAAKPVLTAATAAAAGQIDTNVLGQLVQLLVMKEARELEKSQAEEARLANVRRQRDRNAKDQDVKTLVKQSRCRHLKGGRRGPKTQAKDYAVYQHQFIDFSQYIRCRICGMTWRPDDTADYLLRKGRKIRNHTKQGWAEAVAMVEASSDTMSSSEAIPQVSSQNPLSYKDASGRDISPRFLDVEGNAVSDVQL